MASPFQLARSGDGGIGQPAVLYARYQLDIEIRDYVDGQSVFKAKKQQWEEFGRIGTPPVPPKPPTYLVLWFELQRWPGHLLVDGGLWDQPAWTWEMVDLAGSIYVSLMEKREIVENG